MCSAPENRLFGTGPNIRSGTPKDFWAAELRTELFGVPMWAITPKRATEEIIMRAASGAQGVVAVANVYTLMLARKDADFFDVYRNARLVVPDGMPLIWALNSLNPRRFSLNHRVYGPSLMQEVIDKGRTKNLRHFLYGGSGGSVQFLEARLRHLYPGVEICGHYEPPYRPLSRIEADGVIREIVDAAPHIVWLGIGAPKQELLMREWEQRVACMMIGVGAAFDFHSGRVKQAPQWMASHGLEWLFRLVSEPRRLWRRYLWSNPRFLALWIKALVMRSNRVRTLFRGTK